MNKIIVSLRQLEEEEKVEMGDFCKMSSGNIAPVYYPEFVGHKAGQHKHVFTFWRAETLEEVKENK